MRKLAIVLSILLFSPAIYASPFTWWDNLDKNNKSVLLAANVMADIAIYGYVNWGYGDHDAHATNEDWFQLKTESGGADKLGHLWTALTLTQVTAELHRGWGFSPREAAWRGAWTTYAAITFMEIGDAFSKYGFSPEDMAVNTLGTLVGYYLYVNPDINRKLDFRIEHDLSHFDSDILTDYEHMRYFTAIKMSGFDGIQNPWLKPLELQIGYYTRGFEGERLNRERYLYTGISINFSYLADRLGFRRVAQGLSFFHPPYTTLRHDYGFDD